MDNRFAAFVFMSGSQYQLELMISSNSPRMIARPQKTDMAKLEQTLKANAWADPGSYGSKLGSAPPLFQYGLHDEEWVPLADAKDFVAMTAGPKTVKFYDMSYALNARARMDRNSFQSKTLKLNP